jgi:predicted O-methyltransferase YrrM
MSIASAFMTPALQQYISDHSVREFSILKELREETRASFSSYRMQTAPEQMQFLMMLVKMLNAKQTLEVGTFAGYSALAIALALPESGRIISCDVDERATKVAKRYWKKAKVDNKIELRLGPALETLDQLLNQNPHPRFDFAYIDADKANLIHYYEKSLALVRPQGIIAIDNVLWDGRVADPTNKEPSTEAIRAFNEKVYRDHRVEISLIPLGDGLTLARKK